MNPNLLVLVLALGFCPLLAQAQFSDRGPVQTAPLAGLAHDGSGVMPTAEPSPNASPSPDWVNVLGYDFIGYASGFKGGMWLDDGLICLSGSTNTFVSVRLDIPHGRKIRYFRLWGLDNSATNGLTAMLWENCLPDIASAPIPSMAVLASVSSTGAPGNFTAVTALNPAPVVDAHLCTYWATVQYTPDCDNASVQVRKIHVEHTK